MGYFQTSLGPLTFILRKIRKRVTYYSWQSICRRNWCYFDWKSANYRYRNKQVLVNEKTGTVVLIFVNYPSYGLHSNLCRRNTAVPSVSFVKGLIRKNTQRPVVIANFRSDSTPGYSQNKMYFKLSNMFFSNNCVC